MVRVSFFTTFQLFTKLRTNAVVYHYLISSTINNINIQNGIDIDLIYTN